MRRSGGFIRRSRILCCCRRTANVARHALCFNTEIAEKQRGSVVKMPSVCSLRTLGVFRGSPGLVPSVPFQHLGTGFHDSAVPICMFRPSEALSIKVTRVESIATVLLISGLLLPATATLLPVQVEHASAPCHQDAPSVPRHQPNHSCCIAGHNHAIPVMPSTFSPPLHSEFQPLPPISSDQSHQLRTPTELNGTDPPSGLPALRI